MSSPPTLDLVCIGRTCVDLYGEQNGAPLESVQSFQMYVGGSASNVCIGAARLGLRTAMIARVGDEPLGRFVRTTFANECVDVRAVRYDAERLTGLITLAIRKCADFPRLFFYEDSADLALDENDIDEQLVASAAVLLATGTHCSRPNLADASRKAMLIAKENGRRVAFDVDFRPVLWGLTSHGGGTQMFIESEHVSAHLQSILPECDLVVGTQEELCIAGGSQDIRTALETIRSLTTAAIVRKRGAQGSIVYPSAIPNDLEEGVSAAPFPVEVLNSTGAGDAFMAGFLSGWVRNENWETCCRYGNACGAMVVSRHACSAAMPSQRELKCFLTHPNRPARLWEDRTLNHLHWATRRKGTWPELHILAFDHRTQFEEQARQHGRSDADIRAVKLLIGRAWQHVARGHQQAGAIIDGQYGGDLIEQLTGAGHWLARPIEQAGVTPLRFVDGPNVGLTLRSWPQEHVVKCLVRYDLECDEALRKAQEARLQKLFSACRELSREVLIEVLPTPAGDSSSFDISAVIHRLYELGIFPDWWKIECPETAAVWQELTRVIESNDADCRGVVLLGKGIPLDELWATFALARRFPICKGFAVGRSIFHKPVDDWFKRAINDEACVQRIEHNFRELIQAWEQCAKGGGD